MATKSLMHRTKSLMHRIAELRIKLLWCGMIASLFYIVALMALIEKAGAWDLINAEASGIAKFILNWWPF